MAARFIEMAYAVFDEVSIALLEPSQTQ